MRTKFVFMSSSPLSGSNRQTDGTSGIASKRSGTLFATAFVPVAQFEDENWHAFEKKYGLDDAIIRVMAYIATSASIPPDMRERINNFWSRTPLRGM